MHKFKVGDRVLVIAPIAPTSDKNAWRFSNKEATIDKVPFSKEQRWYLVTVEGKQFYVLDNNLQLINDEVTMTPQEWFDIKKNQNSL